MMYRHSFTTFLRRGVAPITTTTTTTATTTTTRSRRIPPVTAQSAVGTRFLHIENRIEELGFQLPPPAPPRANYNSACWSSGNTILYLSGHLPFNTAGTELTKGRIGEGGRDVEYGYQAARQVALGLVATLKDQLGDLDRVEQIVKVFGIVQSADDFKEQHLVLNGCSDVMIEIFGDKVGFHARSAIGTSTLPLDVTVEIEAIVQVKS